MSQEVSIGQCAQCGKRYRVPDPERDYRCKSCGGSVRVAAASEDAEVRHQLVQCEHCGAPAASTDTYCGACGEPLGTDDGDDSAASGDGAGDRRGGRERAERRQAGAEMMRALGYLKALRAIYLIGAVLNGLALAYLLWILVSVAYEIGIDRDTGLFYGIVLLLPVISLTLHVVGAIRIYLRPFFWAVVLACMVTLSRALGAYGNDFSLLWTIGGAVWAALFWILAIPTARIRRLLEEHPDLHASKQFMRGEHHRAGRDADPEWVLELADARARVQSWIAVALIVGISGAVWLGVTFTA